MCKLVLPWMVDPPDPNVDYVIWSGFCNALAGWLLGLSLVTIAVIIALYVRSARRKKICRPRDSFAPFTPMYWLWLALAPAVLIFIIYAIGYRSRFSHAGILDMGGAVGPAIVAGALSFLLAYLLMCIPGITPAKYRYRPRWLFYRNRGARR